MEWHSYVGIVSRKMIVFMECSSTLSNTIIINQLLETASDLKLKCICCRIKKKMKLKNGSDKKNSN